MVGLTTTPFLPPPRKRTIKPTDIFGGSIIIWLVETYINACNKVFRILFTDCIHSHFYIMCSWSMKSMGQNAQFYPLYTLETPLLWKMYTEMYSKKLWMVLQWMSINTVLVTHISTLSKTDYLLYFAKFWYTNHWSMWLVAITFHCIMKMQNLLEIMSFCYYWIHRNMHTVHSMHM